MKHFFRKIFNKLRLVCFKLNLLRKREINSRFRYIKDFNFSYPWGRCLFKHEQQYYADKNVVKRYNNINDLDKKGYNIIIKKEHIVDNAWWNENNVEFDYSSGILYSKESFLYGTFEAEIYIPDGYGLWTAFWLVGFQNNPKKFGEIDIFEYYGDDKKFTYNTHFGTNYENDRSKGADGIRLSKLVNNFHKYRLNWTKKNIKIYIDDKLVGIRSSEGLDVPMNLIINVAIESGIGNKLDKYLPTNMLIKNIKYYENS